MSNQSILYLRKILSDTPTEPPYFELFDLYKVWYGGNEFEKALNSVVEASECTPYDSDYYIFAWNNHHPIRSNIDPSTWNLSELLSEAKELAEQGMWRRLRWLMFYPNTFPEFRKAIESYINDPENIADYHSSLKEQAGCDRYHARKDEGKI